MLSAALVKSFHLLCARSHVAEAHATPSSHCPLVHQNYDLVEMSPSAPVSLLPFFSLPELGSEASRRPPLLFFSPLRALFLLAESPWPRSRRLTTAAPRVHLYHACGGPGCPVMRLAPTSAQAPRRRTAAPSSAPLPSACVARARPFASLRSGATGLQSSDAASRSSAGALLFLLPHLRATPSSQRLESRSAIAGHHA